MSLLCRFWALQLGLAVGVALSVYTVLTGERKLHRRREIIVDLPPHAGVRLDELDELPTLVDARTDNGGSASRHH